MKSVMISKTQLEKQILEAQSKDKLSELISTLLSQVNVEHSTIAKILIDYHSTSPSHKDSTKSLVSNVLRLLKHTPIHYITGSKGFYKSSFWVNDQVLIPRADTEMLLEIVSKHLSSLEVSYIKQVDQLYSILEVGVGSGAISISLGRELISRGLHFVLYAVDISRPALMVALSNAINILPVSTLSICEKSISLIGNNWQMVLIESDVYSTLDDMKFDVVFSNPPYIKSSEYTLLDKHVLHEPKLALESGEDGLDVYRKIIAGLYSRLGSNGVFFGEFNPTHKKELTALFKKNNFVTSIYQGLVGEPRFIKATRITTRPRR